MQLRWTAGGWTVLEVPAIHAAAVGCRQPSTQHRHAALCTWQKKILSCLKSAAKLRLQYVTYVGTGVAARGLLRPQHAARAGGFSSFPGQPLHVVP